MPENVLDLLAADHREVKELVAAVLASDDPAQRRDLADSIIGQLVRHSVAEETIVYPVMRARLPEGDKAVEHDTEEHKELETLMKRLEALDAADPAFTKTMTELQAVLDDHVSDEEDDQFPLIRQHIDTGQLETMGTAVEALKKVAPTRPHPAAPNNALFHLMVGPGVGLVDRLRDKLSARSS
jgi:hemerythrin superfamily protein